MYVHYTYILLLGSKGCLSAKVYVLWGSEGYEQWVLWQIDKLPMVLSSGNLCLSNIFQIIALKYCDLIQPQKPLWHHKIKYINATEGCYFEIESKNCNLGT